MLSITRFTWVQRNYCIKVTMSLHLGFCLITAQQVRIKSSLLQHSHTETQISLHVKNPGLLSLSPCRWRSNIQPSTTGVFYPPPPKKNNKRPVQKWDTTTTKNPSCREAARPLGLDVGGLEFWRRSESSQMTWGGMGPGWHQVLCPKKKSPFGVPRNRLARLSLEDEILW